MFNITGPAPRKRQSSHRVCVSFKTLNQVGFEVMADAFFAAGKPVMFVAGDDATGKDIVLELVTALGFEAIDAGELAVARLM